MKGNQGLEALAALCGGASKAQTTTSTNVPLSSITETPAPAPIAPATTTGHTITSTTPSVAKSTSYPSPTDATAVYHVQQQSQSQQQQQQQQHTADPTIQQWQAASYGQIPTAAATTAAAAAILQAASAVQNSAIPTTTDPNSLMSHFAYYQYMQAAAQAAQHGQVQVAVTADGKAAPAQQPQPTQPATTTSAPVAYVNPVNGMTIYSLPAQPTQYAQHVDAKSRLAPAPAVQQPQPVGSSLQQVLPATRDAVPKVPAPTGSMQPPAQGVPSTMSTQGFILPAQQPRPIAPVTTSAKIVPMKQQSLSQRPMLDSSAHQVGGVVDDKKQQKRAANRRSAQLSRKRKKQFIEELKEENDELRRKEQILKSIPDLIVVFDSAGRVWFVSDSVRRFLDFTPAELEGSSFWDRLCPESVRLLKAAFMDALAARKRDMDTTPLGSGVWELRLVDKDGSHKVITLNGVVHFSVERDSPECVCSIRPWDEKASQEATAAAQLASISSGGARTSSLGTATTTSSAASTSSSSSSSMPNVPVLGQRLPCIRSNIRPQQSVINNTGASGGSDDVRVRFGRDKVIPVNPSQAAGAQNNNGGRRGAAQISDVDSGSVVSESGSE